MPTQLPQKVKIFIIERVAAFDQPSMVVAAVRERFGLSVVPQVVEGHDPTKSTGRQLVGVW
jgi:hypothetical protein